MRKILVIGDLHHRTAWINPFVERVKPDVTVFLGDYFDDFGDDCWDSTQTATWLKDSVSFKNRIHLFGNHDLPYAFPFNEQLKNCSGFSQGKCNAINRVMKAEDWARFKLHHFEDGWLMSHAGIREEVFYHPMKGFNIQVVHKACRAAFQAIKTNTYSFYLGAGRARMGRQRYGGLVWLDWDEEFKPIEGVNQIVGHTPAPEIRTKSLGTNINYCIDTKGKYAILVEGQKVEILKTGV